MVYFPRFILFSLAANQTLFTHLRKDDWENDSFMVISFLKIDIFAKKNVSKIRYIFALTLRIWGKMQNKILY